MEGGSACERQFPALATIAAALLQRRDARGGRDGARVIEKRKLHVDECDQRRSQRILGGEFLQARTRAVEQRPRSRHLPALHRDDPEIEIDCGHAECIVAGVEQCACASVVGGRALELQALAGHAATADVSLREHVGFARGRRDPDRFGIRAIRIVDAFEAVRGGADRIERTCAQAGRSVLWKGAQQSFGLGQRTLVFAREKIDLGFAERDLRTRPQRRACVRDQLACDIELPRQHRGVDPLAQRRLGDGGRVQRVGRRRMAELDQELVARFARSGHHIVRLRSRFQRAPRLLQRQLHGPAAVAERDRGFDQHAGRQSCAIERAAVQCVDQRHHGLA